MNSRQQISQVLNPYLRDGNLRIELQSKDCENCFLFLFVGFIFGRKFSFLIDGNVSGLGWWLKNSPQIYSKVEKNGKNKSFITSFDFCLGIFGGLGPSAELREPNGI